MLSVLDSEVLQAEGLHMGEAALLVAHQAASTLAAIVQRQPGSTAQEARNRVAVAALPPTIALLESPPHLLYGHGNVSELLRIGSARAVRRVLEAVRCAGVGQARHAPGHGWLRRRRIISLERGSSPTA